MSTERILRQIDRHAHAAAGPPQDDVRGIVSDLTRAELARVQLEDRLRAATGEKVRIRCEDDLLVDGTVREVGAQWCEVAIEPRGGAVIPLVRIGMISGLGERSRQTESLLDGARSLPSRLRELEHERTAVECVTRVGTLRGRILGVGQDAVDIASVDDASGSSGVQRVTVPLSALVLIRVR